LNNINLPKIHDLNELCKLCMKSDDSFNEIADQCSELTAYSIQPRYPMELILEEQDMKQAMKNSKAIRNFVIDLATEIVQDGQEKA